MTLAHKKDEPTITLFSNYYKHGKKNEINVIL